MQPDTLAVVAVIALLLVAAIILGFLMNARRSAALRDQTREPGPPRTHGRKKAPPR